VWITLWKDLYFAIKHKILFNLIEFFIRHLIVDNLCKLSASLRLDEPLSVDTVWISCGYTRFSGTRGDCGLTKVLRHVSSKDLADLAEHLRAGGLVAFPTETVYGLGAHAADRNSVEEIFRIKGRPATDPLIVHVSGVVHALRLVDPHSATVWQTDVLRHLAEEFWPGPLTLIVPADLNRIAFEVTASTGWVGLRQPAHPLAQEFLEACAVPVAAPSANLFGHVSPTCADHVEFDFPDVDKLWIIDGGRCGFGIESTVMRINADKTVDIFRRGGVGPSQISASLLQAGLLTDSVAVRVVEKYFKGNTHGSDVAPGQALVHYAPRMPVFMISRSDGRAPESRPVAEAELKNIVLLDFAGNYKELAPFVSHYRDLSIAGSVDEAVYSLFEALRWAETCGAERHTLWIFDPRNIGHSGNELFLALQDRIIRSASARALNVCFKPDSDQVYVSAR
jgi:tRNA threonylcarbamoyl adenosine modification protein (Sua5/YciO/YrdC/YwlC family)